MARWSDGRTAGRSANGLSTGRELPAVVDEFVGEALEATPELPAVLVRSTAAAVVGSEGTSCESAVGSITALGGYAWLRRETLAGRYAGRERDLAVLASDFLHARAHAALGSDTVGVDRRHRCYRLLTGASRSLTDRFLTISPDPSGRGETVGSEPAAVLAGTGCALGATVAGADDATAAALYDYGESIAAGLPGTGLGDRLCGILRGEGGSEVGTAGRMELRGKLREPLATLPESPARRRLERAARLLSTNSVE